jgi:fluoride exporter
VSAAFFLVVAAGGFVGAPSRYLLDRAVTRRVNSDLPWGTFVINITGFLTGLTLSHHLSDLGKALVGTGFCGAYTTFSTFTFETIRLVQDGRYLEAAGYVSVSVVVGLAAATAGLALGLAT